jgi:threonine/homoserine/homoserine lactone efflux protein
MSLEFLITSLIVILLPGTGAIYTMVVGLGHGFRASVAAAFGCTLSILPAALASIIGLAAILHTSALAFHTVKYLGVAYLFFMAWKLLRDGGVLDLTGPKPARSTMQIIVTGTTLNMLNPKLSLFFLAFLPQFVPQGVANPTSALLILAAAFMLMTFCVFIAYGAFASYARDYVIQRPNVMQWIKRCFAASFGALGAKLALSE